MGCIKKSVIQKVSPLAFQCSQVCGCNYLFHLSKVNFDKEKILSLLEYGSPLLETPVLTDLASSPYKSVLKRQHWLSTATGTHKNVASFT